MPKETITCSECGHPREIIRIKKEMLGKKFYCDKCRKTVKPLAK